MFFPDPSKRYSQLDHLMAGYLNQDFELFGSTIEDVVICFMKENAKSDWCRLIEDIENFKKSHSSTLDKSFLDIYGLSFDPSLWRISTSTFFDKVKSTLSKF